MAPKVSLTIVSNEIVFSITEMSFLKKHLHWKYPAVMGDLIDSTRVLMREIQRLSRPESRLTYTACRYHPDDDARFVVYELLGSQHHELKSLVAIQPTENEQRGPFSAITRKPFITVDEVSRQLSNSTKDKNLTNHSSPGGLRAPMVIQTLLNYLSVVAPHIVVQCFGLSRDDKDTMTLSLDLSHPLSLSHYVRLLFDFTPTESIA